MIRSSLILTMIALSAVGATVTEDFASPPSSSGWRIFGDTSLFSWNATSQHLEVTWDSSRSNSYFYHPLDTVLGKDDEFSLAFDLWLTDIARGRSPDKPYAFQLALGFLQLATATNASSVRGSGNNSTNLVEWNYFPAFLQFAPTIAQVVVSTNGQWFYNHDNLRELTVDDLFHISLQFRSRTLTSIITSNGVPFGTPQTISLHAADTDFRVDAVAICSYSDAGQDPLYAGSILAHGIVDNIRFTTPDPPLGPLAGQFLDGAWQIRFSGRSNWVYVLERTSDFRAWSSVSTNAPETDGPLALPATSGDRSTPQFYRVRAERP